MGTIPPPSEWRKRRYRHMAHDHMTCAQDYREHGWLALANEEVRQSLKYSDLAFREETRLQDEQEREHGATPGSLPEAGSEVRQRAAQSEADPASVRRTRKVYRAKEERLPHNARPRRL